MYLWPEAKAKSRFDDRLRLGRAKKSFFAKHIDKIGQSFRRDDGEHLADEQVDIPLVILAIGRGVGMCAQEAGF